MYKNSINDYNNPNCVKITSSNYPKYISRVSIRHGSIPQQYSVLHAIFTLKFIIFADRVFQIWYTVNCQTFPCLSANLTNHIRRYKILTWSANGRQAFIRNTIWKLLRNKVISKFKIIFPYSPNVVLMKNLKIQAVKG